MHFVDYNQRLQFAMNCACRTSSLRIFVQSLTQVQISPPGISRPARHFAPTSLHAYRQHGFVRSFTATSAACYPRQLRRASLNKRIPLPDEVDSVESFEDQPDSHSTPSISDNDIKNARRSGVILDFSPEAIDALAAESSESRTRDEASLSRPSSKPSSRPSSRPVDSRTNARSPTKTQSDWRESSRLKRSKIIPSKSRKSEGEDRPKRQENWEIQKEALRNKFPEGWNPRKRLSPDAIDGIRALHAQYPEQYTTPVLAEQFKVSAEAIRRILKSKWRSDPDEELERQDRWFRRGKNIWSQMAALGVKPPKRWRQEGIVRDPIWNEKRGPRNYWPYVPRRPSEEEDDNEDGQSVQRKLGDNIL